MNKESLKTSRRSPLDNSLEAHSNGSVRNGLTTADIKQAFLDNLHFGMGRAPATATVHDAYVALALTVRDRLLGNCVRTAESAVEKGSRVVSYLSAEFLPGPHLGNNLLNLGMTEAAREAIAELGMDYDALLAEEEEPGWATAVWDGSPPVSWIRW